MKNARPALVLTLLAATLAQAVISAESTSASSCRTFSETGKTVCNRFLDYWQQHGGLSQQGFPIAEEFVEVSEVDGKSYRVQYFERAVFELHPENKPPYDVLLSLLGRMTYDAKYQGGAAAQQPNTAAGSVVFPETGKRLGGLFLEYWRANGALAQQGFPISDELVEKSPLDGKEYRVQYFERAVFEMHPENKPPYDVLLSQLGTYRHRSKYGAGQPVPTAAPAPTSPPAPGPFTEIWVSNKVVTAFRNAGLEVASPHPMFPSDFGDAPMLALEGYVFGIPSAGPGASCRVMSFATPEYLDETRRYYADLGVRDRSRASWLYVKENILVVISGTVPESTARRYEAVLAALKK